MDLNTMTLRWARVPVVPGGAGEINRFLIPGDLQVDRLGVWLIRG